MTITDLPRPLILDFLNILPDNLLPNSAANHLYEAGIADGLAALADEFDYGRMWDLDSGDAAIPK